TGKSPALVIEAHAKRLPERIETRRADVPPYLSALVMKCLAKVPGDRPRSGREIVESLSPTASPRTITGGGVVAVASRLPTWVPWAVAGVASLAAIALGILYASSR
ncbi:MAG TPA: hypothetical protein VFV33_01160, partial [Gemmatimonadaceae bacterium]|nr:hypothetical protein [Gemmatimonadaceae bacterium]